MSYLGEVNWYSASLKRQTFSDPSVTEEYAQRVSRDWPEDYVHFVRVYAPKREAVYRAGTLVAELVEEFDGYHWRARTPDGRRWIDSQ